MFDALARLADGNARRIGLIAIALLPPRRRARRLGRRAASTPTAPTTRRPRRCKADERLEDAGLRVPAVIAVVEDAPVAEPATRARVEALERERARAPRRRLGRPATTTPAPPPSSPTTADSTYFAVALKPTDDKAVAGSRRATSPTSSRRSPGVIVGGAARRPGAGQQAGREGPADGRDARLPAALPALAALLPQPRRRAAAADDRRPGDRRHLPDPARRQRIRLDLDLRPQPDDRRSGSGWRSTTASSSSPATARRSPRTGPGLAAMRRVLATAGRTVFFSSLTVAAALASLLVFPQRFLYSMGLGGVAGGAVRGADLADRAAGGADPARRPGSTRSAPALPAAPRRGRRAARRERLLVPALALRDAPAGPGRDAQRRSADRPRAALLRRSSSTPSTRPCCRTSASARQAYDTVSERVPALPRHADLGSTSKAAAPTARGALAARGRARCRGVAEVARRSGSRGGVTAIAGDLRPTPSSPRRARTR